VKIPVVSPLETASVYDDTQTVKRPTDFDHVCENETTCTIASLDISEQSTLDDTIVPPNDEDSSSYITDMQVKGCIYSVSIAGTYCNVS
jgi:hypothetical protein